MTSVNTMQDGKLDVDRHPDKCPICDFNVQPTEVGGFLIGNINKRGARIEMAFRCTRTECSCIFIARYTKDLDFNSARPTGDFLLRYTAPKTPTKVTLPAEIQELSPNTVTVYSQAAAAEAYELDLIAGGGYRKALEFLIKDYCCSVHHKDCEKIKKMQLGPVISKYVDSERIRQCAKLASWLGNDEVHYLQRWREKDLEDLKALFKLTIHWIESDLLTTAYVAEMNPDTNKPQADDQSKRGR